MSEVLVWALRSARQHTLALVGAVTDEQGLQQNVPGERHPVWLLGHLLLGDVYLLALLNIAPLPPDFQELLASYGPGAVLTDQRGVCSGIDALVDRLTHTGEVRVAAVRELTREELSRATPDHFLAQTQPTIEHHLHALAFHEGYHGGQLAAWRRNHGLPPVQWVLAPRTSGET